MQRKSEVAAKRLPAGTSSIPLQKGSSMSSIQSTTIAESAAADVEAATKLAHTRSTIDCWQRRCRMPNISMSYLSLVKECNLASSSWRPACSSFVAANASSDDEFAPAPAALTTQPEAALMLLSRNRRFWFWLWLIARLWNWYRDWCVSRNLCRVAPNGSPCSHVTPCSMAQHCRDVNQEVPASVAHVRDVYNLCRV